MPAAWPYAMGMAFILVVTMLPQGLAGLKWASARKVGA
jgi:hypothetical protein